MYELVILSLGSNLGDREENLAAAITLLGTFNGVKNIKSASFYESEPLYNTNQPNFLNTIILFENILYLVCKFQTNPILSFFCCCSNMGS